MRQHPEQFTTGIRSLIEEGQAVKTGDYAEAIQFQRELRRKAQAAIGNEIWICPAARGVAPTLETTGDPCMNSPWSFLGFPTITFPMGLSADGLPLGLQLIAAPHHDIELFGGNLAALVSAQPAFCFLAPSGFDQFIHTHRHRFFSR